MKSFSQLIESLSESTVKKYNVSAAGERVPVEIKKVGNKFYAVVAGERLADTHNNQKAAEKDAADFIKLLGG